MSEQIEFYRRLHEQLTFYGSLQLVDFTAAAVEFQRLRKLKLRVGTMDLKIAALALAHGATLFARSLADFRQVPGLPIEDATNPP
jgi:tRNA(fMet)-specific endonuclease VapC